MGINWGASPATAPILSAHPAEEQEVWLSPMMMCTEGARIPTAAVAGAEKGLSVGPTVLGGTSEERCQKIPQPVPFSFSPPCELDGRPPE